MINITEATLLNLGFVKNNVSKEESGDNSFHYFTYGKNNKCILISCANDEVINNQFYSIEIYDAPEFGYIVNDTDLKTFINTLNKFVQKF